MFTVTRSAPAVAALAVLLTACGGADGDVTTTDPGADADTGAVESPTPSPDPADPDAEVSPSPDEPAEPTESPPQPPEDDGPGEGSETEPSPGTGGSESAGQPATELTVRLDPGNGDVAEWTVTCDPAGGTMGDPEAACETLDSISPRDVAPVPPDQACTMQYGGPETATITGSWDGTKVDLSFSKQNGCEIQRWETMEPILPAGDGALR